MPKFQQDLFFTNIPKEGIKTTSSKLEFLHDAIFLQNEKDPCYIWTGTGRINKLEKIIFSSKIKNKLKKRRIKIFLYEPLCIILNHRYNCFFYSEFNSDIEYSSVISEELESIRIFIKNNNLENVEIHTADYNLSYLREFYPDLNLFCFDLFIRHVSIFKKSFVGQNKILKKFWCGNWRYTTHRHLIMSYLINIQEGNYSWNLKCDFNELKNNLWFDLVNYQSVDPTRFHLIKKGVDLLNSSTIRIDTNIAQEIVENNSDVCIPGKIMPRPSDLFLNSYKECFCAIINETRFAQPFANFSEKTIIAIDARLPFIIVAPPRTLEYLKTFGFKTFSQWWDESYDFEENHENRLIKILELIDFINNKSINELESIYKEMSMVLEHNINVMKTVPHNLNIIKN